MTDYCTVDELQSGWLQISDDNDRAILSALITSASGLIDKHCGRTFGQDAAVSARIYSPDFADVLSVDDISTATGLIIKSDWDRDGVYEVTWAANDYQLEPVNNLAKGEPVYTIRSRFMNNYFPRYVGTSVQVTAQWGWPAVPAQVKTACLLQVSRLHMRRRTPGGILMAPDLGSGERLYASLDPDVRVLLSGLVRSEWLTD